MKKAPASLASLLSCLTLTVAVAADWPQYRGPNRDGISAEKGLLDAWPENGPKVLWRAELGTGFSGMAVRGGRIYTMYGRGRDEYAACLDAGSGKEIWRLRIDDDRFDSYGSGPRSTPTLHGDRVYVVGARGKFHALDARTGKSLWSHDLVEDFGARVPRWGVSASPVVEKDLILLEVGGTDGRAIMAFRAGDGAVAWAGHSDRPGYSSPVLVEIHGRRQAVFLTGTALLGLDPRDGTILWQTPWKTSYDVNAAMPLFIAPDRVFVSSGYDVGAGLFRVTRKGKGAGVEEIWKSRVMKNHFNSSVLRDGHIYGFDNAVLKCIEAATGTEKWAQRGFQKGSLLLADGKLIIMGERGQLALAEASPAGYKEIGKVQALEGKTWTMPTLSEKRLYLRSEAEIIALDIAG